MTLDEMVQRFLDACNDIDEDGLTVSHMGYEIELSREDGSDPWYIQVRPHEEGYLYDGWWRGSEGRSIRTALSEAITGSGMLDG